MQEMVSLYFFNILFNLDKSVFLKLYEIENLSFTAQLPMQSKLETNMIYQTTQ